MFTSSKALDSFLTSEQFTLRIVKPMFSNVVWISSMIFAVFILVMYFLGFLDLFIWFIPFLAALFGATSFETFSIDSQAKEMKHIIRYFGIIPVKSIIDLNRYACIVIKGYQGVKGGGVLMHTYFLPRFSPYKQKRHKICLVDQNHRNELVLQDLGDDIEQVKSAAARWSEKLEVSWTRYNPKISAKTRKRRR